MQKNSREKFNLHQISFVIALTYNNFLFETIRILLKGS